MVRLIAAFFSLAFAQAADLPWFSHRQHAPIAKVCTSCHAGAGKAARAGMPSGARCLTCHKGRFQLAATARFESEYDNLPDYVRFSHAKHTRGKVSCSECHGDVTKQDQTEPAKALNMKTCMDCHTKWKATVACGVCHSIR